MEEVIDNYKGKDLDITFEPIRNLFSKYICGGKLGDFIHALSELWIKINEIDDRYKDIVLIHRSNIRHNTNFIQLLDNIRKNNKCYFITCNMEEYNVFPLRHVIPVELKSSLMEMYVAINSCKFFIGNQSSPLAMAYSLFKPSLAELTDCKFYNTIYYDSFNWVERDNNYLNSLYTYIS